jgi:hypothetical protein
MLTDDLLGLVTPDYLPAVFESRDKAEAAVAELMALGLPEADLGIAISNLAPGWYRLLDEEERDEAFGMVRGVEIGLPAGAIAGVALAAFAIPGVGTVLGGGGLALAGAGAFWGTFWGAWVGLMRKTHWTDNEERWTEVPMDAGDVLVLTRPGHHFDQVQHILTRHGALFFLDPQQPDHPIGMRAATSPSAVTAE